MRRQEIAILDNQCEKSMGAQKGFVGEVDIEDHLSQRDVRLLENQYRVFLQNIDSGVKDVMAVKCLNNKVYAFIPQKEHSTKEMIGLAAYGVAACSKTTMDCSKIISSETVTV
jgi:hypothetical protein